MIAAAGDIACSPTDPGYNNGAGTADRCHQRATSDLLVGTPLAAVLPLGDIQYDSASLSNIMAVYDPTWGRVKSISRPIVGNHEGQVENIWLVGSAIAMLVVLIWDVRRRKNAWRSR